MPRIQEYTAENTALHPTETGVDAMAQAARREGSFYEQGAQSIRRAAQDVARGAEGIVQGTKGLVGSLVSGVKSIGQAVDAGEQYASHQEIRTGGVREAGDINNLTTAWNAIINDAQERDPNDRTIQSKFMEQTFEPWAAQFVDSFNTPGGKDWAEQRVAQLRTHFNTKTSSDMMGLDGIAAVSDVNKSATSWTNTARTDPSMVPMLLDTAQDYIQDLVDSHPHLGGVEGARLQEETLQKVQRQIVRAGALGAISQSADPERAWQVWSKRYPDLVDAHEMDQFAKAAKGYQRMNQSEARSDRANQDYLSKQDFNKQADQLLADTTPRNAGDKPQLPDDYWERVRKLSQHPGAALEPGRLQTMVHNGEAITAQLNKPEPLARVSHDATAQLMTDIHNGTMTSNAPIYKAYGDGKLKNGDFNLLKKEFENAQTPEGEHRNDLMRQLTTSVRPTLTRNGQFDPDAGDRLYRWQIEVNRKFDQLRQGGKDPFAVFDPKSPDYMGSRDALKPFVGPLQQIIMGNGGVGATPSGPPGGKPPEPPAAAAAPAGPEKGTIKPYNGTNYEFQGGDPRDRKNWKPVT